MLRRGSSATRRRPRTRLRRAHPRHPRIAVSSVLRSSWLTESRKFRSLSREAASWVAISLNAAASDASSRAPSSSSTGVGVSPAASAWLAAATLRTGRTIERATANEESRREQRPREPREEQIPKVWMPRPRPGGPQQEQAAIGDRAVGVEVAVTLVGRRAAALGVHVRHVPCEHRAQVDDPPHPSAKRGVGVLVVDRLAAGGGVAVGDPRQQGDLGAVDLARVSTAPIAIVSASVSPSAARAAANSRDPGGSSRCDSSPVPAAAERADQLGAAELAAGAAPRARRRVLVPPG